MHPGNKNCDHLNLFDPLFKVTSFLVWILLQIGSSGLPAEIVGVSDTSPAELLCVVIVENMTTPGAILSILVLDINDQNMGDKLIPIDVAPSVVSTSAG